MIRLALSEVAAAWRTWLGVALIAAGAGIGLGVAAVLLDTATTSTGEALEGLTGIAASIVMFTAVAAIAITATVAKLAVDLQRATYARWALIGVSPRVIASAVTVQILVSATVGAAAGVWASIPLAEPWLLWGIGAGVDVFDNIEFRTGILSASIAVGVVVVTALLGSRSAARSAAVTQPLALLRDADVAVRRPGVGRWIAIIVTAALAVLAFGSLYGDEFPSGQLVSLAPLLTVAVITAGPVVYPAVMRAWTRLIPARLSPVWYLARHQALFHLGRSSASITPLFIGAALVGGLFATAGTVSQAGAGQVQFAFHHVLLIFGGAIVLSGIGAAVAVFMSNRTQGREQALLSATGARPGAIVLVAVLQAMIHVISAAILAAGVILATGLVIADALSRHIGPITPNFDPMFAVGLTAGSFVLTIAATVIPTLTRIRTPVAQQLRA